MAENRQTANAESGQSGRLYALLYKIAERLTALEARLRAIETKLEGKRP